MVDMENASKVKGLKQELGPSYHVYEQVKNLKKIQGAQARMPFEIRVQ
jgi:protease-4